MKEMGLPRGAANSTMQPPAPVFTDDLQRNPLT